MGSLDFFIHVLRGSMGYMEFLNGIRGPRQPLLNFSSLEELAALTQSTPERLRELGRHEVDLYDDVLLKNPRTGKVRHLSIPQPELKQIQKALLGAMKVDWYNRNYSIAHAYIPRRSIRSAANQHPWSKTGFKVDIKDYFPSINQMKLMDEWGFIHASDQTIDYRGLRLIITGLATRMPRNFDVPGGTFLPQGSPTSGFFANLATRSLDQSLWKIARNEGFRVTRYSDDILFTSDTVRSRVELEQGLERAQGAIRQHGFEVNKAKSRIMTEGSRMEALGLMIDGPKPRLSRTKRKKFESEMRSISKFGFYEHAAHRGEDPETMFRRLSGYLAFAAAFDKDWAGKHKADLKESTVVLELPVINFDLIDSSEEG